MQNANTIVDGTSKDGGLNEKEVLVEKHHGRELEDDKPATRGLEKAADEKDTGGNERKSNDALPDENKDQADKVVTEKGNTTTDIAGGPTDDEETEDESKYLSGVKLWTAERAPVALGAKNARNRSRFRIVYGGLWKQQQRLQCCMLQ